MQISLLIPENFAARHGDGAALERRVLEAFGLAEYRAGRMTFFEVQRLLDFTNGPERDAFLKAHGIVDGVTPIELENAHSNQVAAGDAVERSRALRADKTLGGLDVVALTREGSR